ncbi:hypothetical protein L798_03355 [Zootermopsis nevadensis]|uniref:Uncharacterized protein n=1 Tax=Zootermopsis nevadensis TaxID=136037 RepID=A0A067QIG9_ZOONE|nr:hypothetical protein L798_03355 [Zootermopsis nevadensis]
MESVKFILAFALVIIEVLLSTGYENRRFSRQIPANEGRGRSISPAVDQLSPGFYRRSYKSSCRCEKISNCPVLQISIPRCPSEQFLCCFPKTLQ